MHSSYTFVPFIDYSMSGYASVPKTTLQLYRDCLRLVRHVAPGHTKKAMALKMTVRAQFAANRDLTDEHVIAAKKGDAVRALSNYLLLGSAQQDGKLTTAMNNYHDTSVKEAKSRQTGGDDKELK